MSKVVFTSHCICFYYRMICPVSSAHTISVVSFTWPRYIGCWLWTGHCSGYLFLALVANQILIYVSSKCITGFVYFTFTVCWLTLNRSLFQFYCICHCLLARHWFVQCQEHLYIGVSLHYNSGSMAANLNKLLFQYVYLSLGYCVFTSF